MPLMRLLPAPFPRSITRLAVAVAIFPALGLPVRGESAAQPPAHFHPAATADCVARAQSDGPSRSGHAVLDCPGRAAQACIAQPRQDNTLGMIECLDAERRYWDARLNSGYARRLADARRQDDEAAAARGVPTSIEASLRAMQRAWMTYRDTACRHEQALWMGGTGGGPATMSCHLHETAQQALRLEGWWRR